jgi:hypothetical protein
MPDIEPTGNVNNQPTGNEPQGTPDFANMSPDDQAKFLETNFYKTSDNAGDNPDDKPPEDNRPDTSSTERKLKFKENGQDVEVDINTLIDVYQKSKHFARQEEYTREMQRLAEQRRQAEKPAPAPEAKTNPVQEAEELDYKVTQRAMKMLGIADPNEFVPDSTGIIGKKAHYAAYQKALLDISNEETQSKNEKARQEQERESVNQRLKDWENEVRADPNGTEIVEYAEKAIFKLRVSDDQKDRSEFQRLAPSYFRFASGAATPADIDTLRQFYKEQHAAYYKARFAPKNIQNKPAPGEKPGSGDATPQRMSPQDFAKLNKDQQADVLGRMLEAKTKRKGW